MAIPHLHAGSYQRRMTSGRTRPCLFFCENDQGEMNGEYVVKLRAGIDNPDIGLFSELMGSQLAQFLDIQTPEPAIIIVNPELADIINDSQLEGDIRRSAGNNFGSKVITGGYDTWPIGEAIPPSLKQLACEVFAFDAMIQNPDRKTSNPNILWCGDELYIIDHETGFSFIYDILPQPEPWRISNMQFLRDHLFYPKLKEEEINLDRFAGALETLTEEHINNMIANIPEEWDNIHIPKITDHLNGITNHVNGFIDEVRRILQ